jgi:hypothetical protein
MQARCRRSAVLCSNGGASGLRRQHRPWLQRHSLEQSQPFGQKRCDRGGQRSSGSYGIPLVSLPVTRCKSRGFKGDCQASSHTHVANGTAQPSLPGWLMGIATAAGEVFRDGSSGSASVVQRPHGGNFQRLSSAAASNHKEMRYQQYSLSFILLATWPAQPLSWRGGALRRG